MSYLPRTEAARIDNAYFDDGGAGKSRYVLAEFANDLEQEITQLREALDFYAMRGTEISPGAKARRVLTLTPAQPACTFPQCGSPGEYCFPSCNPAQPAAKI
jgi:hypothetical protein